MYLAFGTGFRACAAREYVEHARDDIGNNMTARVLVIYQGSRRKFVFQGGARGRKQKYDSAWGTECAGRGAGSCTPAMPYGIECIRTYGVAWRMAVRPAATAFQRLPKPKPISRIPISLLPPSPGRVLLALFPCCPTLYPLRQLFFPPPPPRLLFEPSP